jgi:4a-hydroxytetrahydrobiopterin dehydratase
MRECARQRKTAIINLAAISPATQPCAIVLKSRENRMTELAKKTCVPCKGGVPPLKGKELADLARQVRGWKVVEEHHIEKSYNFSDFVSALEFVKAIGAVAEEQGHHPDILLRWGRVTVTIWTHKIDGLTESDFILAAKIDEIPRPQVSS